MFNQKAFIATPETTSPTKLQTVAVLFLVLAVRLVHLGSTAHNPLTFQPGPDEDFYHRFGRAVAENTASDTTEFAFMDPAYGYILGLIFKVTGTVLFPVYLIQAVLDTVTAWILMLIGRELDRPVEGMLGALLYGFAGTAVMYSTALLKAAWTANFMALWVLLALWTIKNRGIHLWIVFGLFCGYGIALRSNLLLMFL
ncbi:MAG: glycosyltransferase family 39 protein, partial [Gammaproteobacteria bacterium]